MKELENTVDYFPYIGHEINYGEIILPYLWESIFGNILNKGKISSKGEDVYIDGHNCESPFSYITIKKIEAQKQIAKEPCSVEVFVPRHRSLYDYTIEMPIHNMLINPEVMLLAGQNLFIAKYDSLLRKYGAVMFIRKDAVLKRKGLPKVFLSVKRYFKDVFPAYLKKEMIEGVGEKKLKKDLIIYPGQEKDPVTQIRDGGRSKSGKLRKLNPIFFEKFRLITKGSSTKFYITPVNISFSKYPDAPYIIHPSKYKGVFRKWRYLMEQIFIYKSYPRYAIKKPDAKLEIVLNYGKPQRFSGDDFDSMSKIIRYVKHLRDDIGKLEIIFPLTFLFRVMDTDTELSIHELKQRAKKFYDQYNSAGINLEKISDRPGEMMNIKELADRSVAALNSNPPYHIRGIKTDFFLTYSSGRIISHDSKLQNWYANNIRHLDP